MQLFMGMFMKPGHWRDMTIIKAMACVKFLFVFQPLVVWSFVTVFFSV